MEMSSKEIKEFKLTEKIKAELFAAIEQTMEDDNISQGEIARRIGIFRYNVNKIMRKKVPVSVDFLLKFAESIGLNVEMRIKKTKN